MSDQVQDLIAKKNFPKAIEALRAQTQAKPHDRRLRLQLADVYVMADRGREAVPVLMTLADQEAKDGFAAKAIAILKRIEKIDPGRRDVEDRLAKLIQDKSRRSSSSSSPAPPPVAPPGVDFGFEEIDTSTEIELGVSSPDPGPSLGIDLDNLPEIELTAEPALTSPEAASMAPAEVAPEVASEVVLSEVVPEFDESFAVESDPEEPSRHQGLSTVLFDGFSSEELVAVMHGLELRSFEAGDVIVAEGTPGDSMFILTSGKVKAYVKSPQGRSLKVQEFEEGDFFGEIAVLTGKPRTATLTAAVECDCLELSRVTLDEITKTHPGVREVLKRFQKERALSTVQAIMADKE
jgi:hypothetical protein